MSQILIYFEILIPVFLIIAFVFSLCIAIYVYIQKKKGEPIYWKTLIAKTLLTLTILGIVLVTCFPSPLSASRPRSLNLIPFSDMFTNNIVSLDSLLSGYFLNILLFIPFGFFFTLINSKQAWHQCLFMGMLFSIGIEIAQLVLPLGRATTLEDILLNTLGAFIGIIIFKRLLRLTKKNSLI